MREPTTIPEYKQFCKALKLKVLKQKTIIETQQQQIQKLQAQIKLLKKSGLQVRNENDPSGTLMSSLRNEKTKNSTDIVEIESACGKNQVMKKFKNGACSFGITPQSVFRIADFTYKGQVQSDYFRQILSKINLGLSPMEISCLIYIFDQSCTGFINKDDFNDSLNAYKVSIQQSYLPYTNYCLQKLAKLVQQDRIQVMKFFQQMQGKNVNSVDINRFYQKLKSVFNKRLQNRQIIGAFNLIDLENDGIVSKKNFIYSVTSAINKLSNPSHSQVKKGSSFQDHVNPAFQRSNLSASGKKSAPTPFNDNNQSTFSTKIRQKESNENQVENIQSHDIIERIYNNYKITLSQIYEQICRKPLNKRLTLFQFKKILHSFKNSDSKIDYELSSILFKLIDTDQRGTIHYRQLINFYLHHQTDMSIIFHLIAIYFTNNDLNSEKFWNMFGVSSDSDVSKAKFLQIMSKTFSNREKNIQIWQKVWSYFDKGRGIISVSQINKQLTKYSIQQ